MAGGFYLPSNKIQGKPGMVLPFYVCMLEGKGVVSGFLLWAISCCLLGCQVKEHDGNLDEVYVEGL